MLSSIINKIMGRKQREPTEIKRFYYRVRRPLYYGLSGIKTEYGEGGCAYLTVGFVFNSVGVKEIHRQKIEGCSGDVLVYFIPEKAVLITKDEYETARGEK